MSSMVNRSCLVGPLGTYNERASFYHCTSYNPTCSIGEYIHMYKCTPCFVVHYVCDCVWVINLQLYVSLIFRAKARWEAHSMPSASFAQVGLASLSSHKSTISFLALSESSGYLSSSACSLENGTPTYMYSKPCTCDEYINVYDLFLLVPTFSPTLNQSLRSFIHFKTSGEVGLEPA